MEVVEVAEEEEEGVEGGYGFFMDHLSPCPLLKVRGRAAISIHRLALFAFLFLFSFLARLWREASSSTLSNSLCAEDEVNVEGGGGFTGPLSPSSPCSSSSLLWAPSLSLAVQATPGPSSPGVILRGWRVAPGADMHLMAESSALEPSDPYGV